MQIDLMCQIIAAGTNEVQRVGVCGAFYIKQIIGNLSDRGYVFSLNGCTPRTINRRVIRERTAIGIIETTRSNWLCSEPKFLCQDRRVHFP